MKVRTTLLALLSMMTFSVPVEAQVIGTFTWQTQPFCNVITVTIVQQGPFYQLTGSDNLCGAGTAPITGTAAPSSGGAVLAFTVGPAGGPATHISAAIDLATFSGTWSDDQGRVGTFQFAGNTGGSPRPVTPRVTTVAVSGGNGEGVGNNICSLANQANGIEVFIKNAFGELVNARFSFIVPDHSYGQIRADGTIRNGSSNLTAVEHPSPGSFCLVFSNPPTQDQAEATVVSIHAER